MRCSTLSITAACAALTSAQTPADSSPVASSNVGVAFGNITITPGKWISPDDVTSQPDVYVTSDLDTSLGYMLLMLDLNIPDSDVTTASSYSTLVPGLATNTTTRLHWWQGNYTISGNQFVNSSDSLAEYTAPRPRDSTNHTYALYLFEQPASYVVPEEALDGTYYSGIVDARFNFSLADTISQVGSPVAANYFLSDLV